MNTRLPNTGTLKTCATATLIAIALPTITLAEDVQLNSLDGSTSMTGAFIDYQDGRYTLATPLGELLVSAYLVTCEGSICPPVQTVLSDLQANGNTMSGQSSMPANAAAFADPECETTAFTTNNPS